MSAVKVVNLAELHVAIGEHLTTDVGGLELCVWDYDEALGKAPRLVVVGHYLRLAWRALRTGETW